MRRMLCALFAVLLLCPAAFAAQIDPVFDVTMYELTDCTVPVSLSVDEITDSAIRVRFYDEVRYDAADISAMQVGDTIYTTDGETEVELIEQVGSGLYINGGWYDGGITLRPSEGGTWVAVEDDDLVPMVLMGEAELPLSETVTLEHYVMDGEGTPMRENERVSLPASELRAALLQREETELSEYETTLTLENGLVTGLCVEWRP